MSFKPIDTNSKIDPRYYYQQEMSRQRESEADSLHNSSSRVHVTATVTDIARWRHLSEVATRSEVYEGNRWIVTATVPRRDVESLAQKSFVQNIEMGQPVKAPD